LAAQRPKIERSDIERRKETKSLGDLDGLCATRPRSSVSFLLSPFSFLLSALTFG
jgi:hypothetical protein